MLCKMTLGKSILDGEITLFAGRNIFHTVVSGRIVAKSNPGIKPRTHFDNVIVV